MSKKQLSTPMIDGYIAKITEDGKVSKGTITTYTNIGKSIPFNITVSQPTIIKKVKALSDNPNTIAANLNLIILVRRDNNLEVDKLISTRNGLSKSITEARKESLSEMDDTLPTYKYITDELNSLSRKRFIINYLFVHHGLRNKDINLQYVKKVPTEGDGNYITSNKKRAKLIIRDYKTEKSHGEKQITIEDEKFVSELKRLGLSDGEYLLSKADGNKITSVSTFNEKIMNLSIDRLGQNRIVKIVVRHLLNQKDFDQLERIAKDRGTSIDVILKSYNLHNGTKKDPAKQQNSNITK